MTTTIIGRAVALVAGAIFTAGALAILLEDVVLNNAPFALKHALTIVIVSGTMLVGHLVVEAWRSRHPLGVIGFAVLFITGTLLVVYKSTGRQAEHTFASEADAATLAQNLSIKSAELENARQRKRDADANVDWEMKGQPDKNGRKTKKEGCGRDCEDWKKRATEVQSHIEKLEREIAELGPQKTLAPEAEQFANTAAVFGFDKAKVKAGAVLIEPFVQTVLFELGGIWCLGFAFRHQATQRHSRQPGQLIGKLERLPAATLQITSVDAGNPDNGGKRVYSKLEAEQDLVTLLALGETVGSQDELAGRWSVNKSTVSKWLNEWRSLGLVPAAQRMGRCHRISTPA
jgi:F0F1-type ATP synthase assembly protein I